MHFLKTTLLLATLTGLLVAVGGLIGGVGGAAIFLIIAAAMNFFAYWFSDKMALKMAGAQEITQDQDPALFAMVDEIRQLAKMPMPRVFVIQNDSPNAFATGRDPKHAVVAVTTGIRRLLTERELRGVLGHEMAHVKNRDILWSSIAATLAGGVQMIAQVLMFSSLFGGRNENSNPMLQLVAIIIAPIAAMMIQMGISRTREYGADDTGSDIVNDPEALASALEKLKRGIEYRPMAETPQQEAVAALYIANPFNGAGMSKLFSTHPPLDDRIARLRAKAANQSTRPKGSIGQDTDPNAPRRPRGASW